MSRIKGRGIHRLTRQTLIQKVQKLALEVKTCKAGLAQVDFRVYVMEQLLREKLGITEADVQAIIETFMKAQAEKEQANQQTASLTVELPDEDGEPVTAAPVA